MKLPRAFPALVLSGIAFSLFALNIALASPTGKQHPTDPVCWCCYKSNGKPTVIQATPADCQKKHGQCYQTSKQAHDGCKGLP